MKVTRHGRILSVLFGLLLAVAAPHAQSREESTITAWISAFDEAFVSKDLARLAVFYHPDVTIFEGGGTNEGWADYRDHHIGPELQGFADLRFSHSNVRVRMLGADTAYVTSEYALKARVKDRDVDTGGLETLVLLKSDGRWRIRHSHTSARRRPQG